MVMRTKKVRKMTWVKMRKMTRRTILRWSNRMVMTIKKAETRVWM